MGSRESGVGKRVLSFEFKRKLPLVTLVTLVALVAPYSLLPTPYSLLPTPYSP
jgi:hypothetical protein